MPSLKRLIVNTTSPESRQRRKRFAREYLRLVDLLTDKNLYSQSEWRR